METEDFLNALIDSSEVSFAAALRRIRRAFDSEIDAIPGRQKLRPSQSTLKFGRKVNRKSKEIFRRNLASSIAKVDSSYNDIDKFTSDFLDGVDLNTGQDVEIDRLKRLNLEFYDRLTEESRGNLNTLMTDHIIGGLTKDELKEAYENELLGVKDRRGKPLITSINQITQDAVMEYHARVNVLSAQEAQVTSMKYTGSIIVDSRSFCVEHAGKTFTLQQIRTLGSNFGQWSGKKSDNVLVHRGGFNCRHHWQPVVRA